MPPCEVTKKDIYLLKKLTFLAFYFRLLFMIHPFFVHIKHHQILPSVYVLDLQLNGLGFYPFKAAFSLSKLPESLLNTIYFRSR